MAEPEGRKTRKRKAQPATSKKKKTGETEEEKEVRKAAVRKEHERQLLKQYAEWAKYSEVKFNEPLNVHVYDIKRFNQCNLSMVVDGDIAGVHFWIGIVSKKVNATVTTEYNIAVQKLRDPKDIGSGGTKGLSQKAPNMKSALRLANGIGSTIPEPVFAQFLFEIATYAAAFHAVQAPQYLEMFCN